MGQLGFFDAKKRLSSLSKKGDLLEERYDRVAVSKAGRADRELVLRFDQHLNANSYMPVAADRGCEHRASAEAAQQPRGERGG
jgi:hypothetical protein